MEIIKNENLISETTPLAQDLTPNVTTKKGIKLPHVLIFLLAIATIIIFLSYLVGLWPISKTKITSSPLPAPVINKPLNLVPSSIATDAAFLKLETDLKTLQNENNTVDLSEPKISFPNLEMNVTFDK